MDRPAAAAPGPASAGSTAAKDGEGEGGWVITGGGGAGLRSVQ